MFTGVLFALVAWKFLPTLTPETLFASIFYLVIVSVLMVITVYDARHKIIPDPFVFVFIILSGFLLFFDLTTLTLVTPRLWHVLAGPILASVPL